MVRLILAVAAAAILLTVVPAFAQQALPPRQECAHFGTPQEAEKLAREAADHLAANGYKQAFSDFLSPNGGFMRDDLYVFAFDQAGNMWVNGGYPELIGSNILGARDPQGRPFLAEGMLRAARDGTAWVEYTWYNPCSGKVMAKSTFIIAVGDFFVAVGAYGTVGI